MLIDKHTSDRQLQPMPRKQEALAAVQHHECTMGARPGLRGQERVPCRLRTAGQPATGGGVPGGSQLGRSGTRGGAHGGS